MKARQQKQIQDKSTTKTKPTEKTNVPSSGNSPENQVRTGKTVT
jgi:hypothetical protein